MPATMIARARFRVGTQRKLMRTIRSLRQAARRAEMPQEIVAAAFSIDDRELSISPVQVKSEIEAFVSLLRQESPQRLLEIGTANGGTLYLLAWASRDDATILSLDIRAYDDHHRKLYRSFAHRQQTLAVRQADSHLDSTRAEVEQFFHDQLLDVLFIDGDHDYDSVRRDYELYSPLVRPGGLIAFHDIVDGPSTAVGDVPRFWREVRGSLGDPSEIVESSTQGGFGIGVGRRH